MTHHLTDEQYINYIYQLLPDTEREEIDRHLSDCPPCRSRLADHETLQRQIHYSVAARRRVTPASPLTFAVIAPRLKRTRSISMILKQSNQVIYGAIAMALVVALGIGLYFLVSNFSRPVPAPPEEIKQPTPVSTVVSQPEIKPTATEPEPTVVVPFEGGMYRGNPQRTGNYGDIKGPEKGEVKWKFKIGSGDTASSPVLVNSVVYVGSVDHHIYAVDAASGQEKWKFKTGGVVWSSPAVVNNILYVGSRDHYLYALDAQTGQLNWRYETGDTVDSSPLVANNMVYFGSYDHYLYALDAQTGRPQWRFETAAEVYSSPAVADGVVYVGSGCSIGDCHDSGPKQYLYALDAQSGQEKWRFETNGPVDSSPAVVEGLVYFISSDGYLHAVDTQTGQEKWQFLADVIPPASPTVAGGVVYLNGVDTLYALDGQTGQEKWRSEIGQQMYAPITVAAGTIYLGGDIWEFQAIDTQTGQLKWKFKAEGAITSVPAVGDGVAYFTSWDGYLYALGASEPAKEE